MIIDATFWVAISFIIFIGCLIYLKIPQKINNLMNNMIRDIKNVNKIAIEISSEIVRKILNIEANVSSVSAIVEDVSKKKLQNIYDN